MSAQPNWRNTPQVDLSLSPRASLAAKATIWPVAGGKGGTGKSTMTANIGIGLAMLGYKVVLVDCDLGGADLHLFFDQIAPPRSLASFINKEYDSLEEIMLPTPNENLHIICGGNEMIGMANMSFKAKQKIIRHLYKLEADYVIIDLGAGSTFNTLDFFSLSDEGLLVCTPEPQARVDAYGFIKNAVYRKLNRLFCAESDSRLAVEKFARDAGSRSGRLGELVESLGHLDPSAADQAHRCLKNFRPRLLLNRVRNKRQIEEVRRFKNLVREYLSVEMEYVGFVRSDDKILDACERRRPVLLESPKAAASRDVFNVLLGGMHIEDRLKRYHGANSRKMSQAAKAEAKFW
jgi:flagellar biosynthesis protein FlhG